MNLLFIDGEVIEAQATEAAPQVETIIEIPAEETNVVAAEAQAQAQPAGSGWTFWIMILAMMIC